nr:class I SAM-dependent DNA methyltransferase [Candidatus Cyanaurora vandensis]
MLIGEIRNQVDQIWNAFWSGGVSNPLSVIEQITYLLFIKRLDDLQTLEESKAEALGIAMERRIFPEGSDNLRWSHFKNFEPRQMMEVVDERVFPFLRTMGEKGSSYGRHMKDARLGFSNPALLAKTVEMLDKIPMEDRDTKGDLYEYMLGKIASAGQNGQFRTPRHIIRLMVELTQPTPNDVICDPAAGTCGFLVAAGEYLREHYPSLFRKEQQRKHFHEQMFHGYDFDPTMLRIGSMNMTLHGVDNPDVSYRDSLAQDQKLLESEQVMLWIIAPTLSVRTLQSFGAYPREGWPAGVYFMPEGLRSALVAIHQLPAHQKLCPYGHWGAKGPRRQHCKKFLALRPMIHCV